MTYAAMANDDRDALLVEVQRIYEARLSAKDALIAELRRQVPAAEPKPSGQQEGPAATAGPTRDHQVKENTQTAASAGNAREGSVPPSQPAPGAGHAAATRHATSSAEPEDPGLLRVEAFSDGVFAIAITLLVLDIRLPDDLHGRGLFAALGDIWPNYLSFLLSFIIVGLVWTNHRTMFSHIKRANQNLVVLNLLLLLNIAFLPFPAAQLARFATHPSDREAAALLYTGWLTLGGVFYNALWRYALAADLTDSHADPAALALLTRRYALGPILYGVAFLLAFVSSQASLGLCAVLAILYLLPNFTHQI